MIQLHTNWYRIAEVVNDTLRLASLYVEDAVTDGSYRIAARFHALPVTVRTYGDFINMRRRLRLKNRR